MADRSQQISSFNVIKGSLIEETYVTFQHWSFEQSKQDNFRRLLDENPIGAKSESWLVDVFQVVSRRFDPNVRDKSLVSLAKSGCSRDIWRPLMLWHMTRDEFLVRDFLLNWLYPQFIDGAYRFKTEDVIPYVESLPKKAITLKKEWSARTTSRVASNLLKLAADFHLMTGVLAKEFSSYHLPEASFLYLLHAMAEQTPNANQIINSPDWRMFLMSPKDVERELFNLHQYRKLNYEVAGSLAQLKLPFGSLADFAKEMM